MRLKLSPEVAEALVSIAKSITDQPVESIHISQPRICDHCKNTDKESFPYNICDVQGKFWEYLCNDCFDEIECLYSTEE